jgi:hypothetical protein
MNSEFLPGTEIPLDSITNASMTIYNFEDEDKYEKDTYLKLNFEDFLDLLDYLKSERLEIYKMYDIFTGKTWEGKKTNLNCLELVTLWTKNKDHFGSKVWIEIPQDWIPLNIKIKAEERKDKINIILDDK